MKIEKPHERCLRLWKKLVKARAGNKCEHCGGTKVIQANHVIPSTNWSLRFDERNGVALCYRCHFHWWHKNPIEAIQWFIEHRGRFEYDYLLLRKHSTAKNDYGLLEIYLEQKIKELEK